MNDPGMADQGVVGRRGLLVVDVETQTAETTVVEGGSGCGGVDEAAPGRVHDDRAGLDGRQRGLVQQCGAVFLGQRMETHKVGRGQQLGKIDHPGTVLLGHVGRDVRFGGQHRHLEGQRPVAHGPPYAAEADQAQRGAGQLHAQVLLAIPVAGRQRVVSFGDTASGRQHQREGVLGRGQSVGLGSVDHRNAPLGRGRQIDVVDAHASAADHPQARPGRDQLGVHPAAAAHDQRGRVPHRLQQLRPALALREHGIHTGIELARRSAPAPPSGSATSTLCRSGIGHFL